MLNTVSNIIQKVSTAPSWVTTWIKLTDKVLFFGQTKNITAGRLYNEVEGSTDYITVGGAAGSETYQCPNTATYIAADTDSIWFQLDTSPRTVTTAELIGYDLQRTPIKYDDDTPNIIRTIMILDDGAVLTENEINYMFRTFRLHPLWSDSWNDNGVIKSNRSLEQLLWTPA